MNWFQRNFKTLIYCSFLVPILTVAFVSISHVTKWYGISNPVSWAIYLSVGIEIAALSALAAISAQMGRKVYFPFIIVTLIQFIGNIFFAYQYIDINSQTFKDWMDLVNPIVSFMGVEDGDPVGHKRFLALFAGGMLPLISLSFLHMLVKFEEEEKKKSKEIPQSDIDIDTLSIKAGKIESELLKEEEKEKYTPKKEDLEKLDILLSKLGYKGSTEENELNKPYSATEDELNKIEEVSLNSSKSEDKEENQSNMEGWDAILVDDADDIKDFDVTLMDGLEEEENIYDSEGGLISSSNSETEEPKLNRLVYTK